VKIGRMAGFEVPADTSILAAEIQGVGPEHPLSREKLSPVLALYFTAGFEESMDACEAILHLGGLGHTCVIFSNDDVRIRQFGARMSANRVLVNTPAPHGSVGLTTNVFPSMTLGCGAAAGNVTSDNVGPQHLFNIRRLAWAVRRAEDALEIPGEAGAEIAAPLPAPVPARAPVAAATLAGVATEVVDRFLSSRGKAIPSPAADPPGCACPAPLPAPAETAPAPEIRVVDFVCENDVRDAIAENRKIFIGPKTIVTPSARETAANGDILVLAKRS
jgi:hypothetical protein